MIAAEYRARKTIEKERKRIEMKQKANQLYAQGYSPAKIADILGVTEGTVRLMISVNGGF